MRHRVLVVGSVPLAKPWNGADKNLARLLVRRDPDNHFVVQTNLEEEWGDPRHVTAVRWRRTDPMPTTAQKLRAFAYTLRHSGSADLIHLVATVHSPTPLAGVALRAVSRLRRRPVLHTVPSVGDRPLDRRNFVGDATVVVSEHTRRRLTEAGIPKVFLIYPPLDVDALEPQNQDAPAQVRRRLGLGQKAILYPAHYGERSGISETLRAFAEARALRGLEDTTLVLACRTHPWQDREHEERTVLDLAEELGIKGAVRITGSVADMPALILACTVTALVPEKLGGKMDLPLVVLESLALGRPAIVSDRAPINEALLDGGGYAVPYGDVRALSRAMSRLLGDSRLRERLAERGRAAVREACDPGQVVEEYHRTYDLLSQTGARRSLASSQGGGVV